MDWSHLLQHKSIPLFSACLFSCLFEQEYSNFAMALSRKKSQYCYKKCENHNKLIISNNCRQCPNLNTTKKLEQSFIYKHLSKHLYTTFPIPYLYHATPDESRGVPWKPPKFNKIKQMRGVEKMVPKIGLGTSYIQILGRC